MKKNKSIIHSTKIKNSISNYAFINREDLTNIVLQDGIKSIGERAFSKCKNLRSIILPESLEFIGASAFSECENIEEIILPKHLKKLNYRTFGDCKRLKRIIIPEGVEELDWGIFAGCDNLEEVILPKSLKKIGKQTFLNCKKLRKVNIPFTIQQLPDECFKGCSNLDIVLNENIIELGNRVFEDCFKLSSFPSHVKSFGKNCFRNCRNITSANINEQTLTLSDGMFDGCINLAKINSSKKLKIGKRCFRNCKSLKEIPSCIVSYNERAFENCTGITSIDVIGTDIPNACFRGCKNLKEVNNQEKIYSMGTFAFSGCDSLEEFEIYNLETIPSEAFSNCKRLKKVILKDGVQTIKSRAFYKCNNLINVNLPDTIETIKKEAFRECNSIVSITIPANLKTFGDAAFSFMNSLQRINVSPNNKIYNTPDHKILINDMQKKIVLYTCGIKDKSYSLNNYNIQYDDLGRELIRSIDTIGEYAFAGAKHLEELTICGCTQNIESTAFYGCDNLKKLNIRAISFYTCTGFNTREHGRYYFDQNSKHKVFLPFEDITFSGELVSIFPNALDNFTKVKKLHLPLNKAFTIRSNAFSDCSLLEEVVIPKEVNVISKGAFNPNTKLKFSNGLELKGLVEYIHKNEYIGDYKLYVLDDDTYYIEQKDKITKLTKHQIDEICSKSEAIREKPVLFLDFMNDLMKHDLAIRQLFNGILMSTMSLENRTILFDNLKKDDNFFLAVIKNSQLLDKKDKNTESLLQGKNFATFVEYVELLRKYNITDPELQNKFFMANFNINDFESLIQFDLELFKKIIVNSELFKSESNTLDEKSNYYLTYQILQNNTLQDFIRLVKKYNIQDKYLFDKSFIATSKNPLIEEMIKVYDANIKRLLKASLVTNTNISAIHNLSDLLILMKITGALEEDAIIRQRASTFISEKIFDKELPNGKSNEYRIIGDDIHRIFNFPYTRNEFDQEFANFFLENYKELVQEEKRKSGFIQRVYLNFRQISKTCTSNKGSQRKLKVTMNKCRNYLSTVKFDGIVEDNKELAKIIGKWYDKNSTWQNAQRIYNESLNAPRNIFTKTEINKEGKIIYDNNPKQDLKEEVSADFSYHWLPKQDYDNLILGKYCNCCAHIEGAGQGIMRVSMILDNCQNLVIRNNFGEIIAKSTIYVNKMQGYAVFNNVESSLNYRDDESLLKIYKAFIRGSNAFTETYNKNNLDHPITKISIGTKRNTILKYLTNQNNHPEILVQKSLKFGEYTLNGSGYAGDWETKQRLVLKRGLK